MEQVYTEQKRNLKSNVNACSSNNNLTETSARKSLMQLYHVKEKLEKNF